jgi:hypothetical protein
MRWIINSPTSASTASRAPEQRLRRGLAVADRRVRRQDQHHAQVRRSTTCSRPDWANTSILDGDLVQEVAKLKQPGRDILMYGFGRSPTCCYNTACSTSFGCG